MRPARHGGWTVVKLPDAPTVDLGFADPDKPITPGAVTTSFDDRPDEWANRIPAAGIQSGEVSADVRVTGSLTSGGTDGRGTTVHDNNGFYTVQPDGSVRSMAPNDPDQPDQWRGDTQAGRLTSGGTSLNGITTVEADSSLVFASSLLGPPNAVPTVMNWWSTRTYPGTQRPQNKLGLAFDAGVVFGGTGVAGYTVISRRNSTPVVAAFEITPTLNYLGAFSFSTTPATIVGIAYSTLRTRLITLEWDAGWQVHYWEMVGSEFVYDPTSSFTWSAGVPYNGSNIPAISCRTLAGKDRILFAQSGSDGRIYFSPYDDGVAATTFTSTTSPTTTFASLVGVADTAPSAVVAFETALLDDNGGPLLAMVDQTTGVIDYIPVGNGNTQAAGVSRLETDLASGFYYLSRADQAFIQHHAIADAGYWWAECSWYKIIGGTQTLPGPPVRFTKVNGSSLSVSMANLPAAATAIMVYIGAETVLDTPPIRTDMWGQSIPLLAGVTSLHPTVIVTGGTFNPLTVGTLTATTGGVAKGSDGSTIFDSTYSNAHDLPYRVAALESGGGGGGIDDDVFFAANGDIIATGRA
jgi:hypothetical protein